MPWIIGTVGARQMSRVWRVLAKVPMLASALLAATAYAVDIDVTATPLSGASPPVIASPGAASPGAASPGTASPPGTTPPSDPRSREPTVGPAWAFAISAYPTIVRGGENYTSAIATADHGPLHLEARVNYEAIGSRSAFVGWTFSGGQAITWEVTPLLGGAWGTTPAFVPGLEATVTWGPADLYVEAEYVRSSEAAVDSYAYAWTELGLRPAPWLRLGLAGQRTRMYGGEREFQRGPFAQVTLGALTVGCYWFNPGSQQQIVVGSIGLAF